MIAKKQDVRLLLDNIRSVHNVGSIFRTAETLGITRIYCGGTTPTPLDRFGRKRRDFSKVALGAEDCMEWEHVEDSTDLVKRLKKDRFDVICLEQSGRSVDYKTVDIKNSLHDKALIILGAEVDGVAPELLELSDVIAEIPMRGKKESLNVSVAAGVFLFRIVDN